ncbi:MAG: hypothetical protein GXO80_00455 [Chlorobi bacterium]|nr:hypothetical protein [Chlorobiota bacterium]
MKKFCITLIIGTLCSVSRAQKSENIFDKADLNAYSQVRFSSNFKDNYNFSLRRLKFWLKSAPDFSENWSYKIQTTISSTHNETFFLQDVKLGYKTGVWSFDFGQFVPGYSLQRFQSDYRLPVIERAKVINCLIPDGTLGARDIGFQANVKTKNNIIKLSLGIFNGYGIKEFRLNNKGVMITHKTVLNIPFENGNLQTGWSGQFRKADNLNIPKVLPDTVLFSGNDFRYNFFIKYCYKNVKIQAEYLTAFLNKEKTDGWYLLSLLSLNKKNEIVFAYEDYKDLIPETKDLPYFHIGYNYLINSCKIKLFFDNYFQINNHLIQNYTASVQLQIFFNQNI